MYVQRADDALYPACRMCGAPVRGAFKETQEKWAHNADSKKPIVYFCSPACIRAKYIG